MYDRLLHYTKGDFMVLVSSGHGAMADAVEITDIEGKSIVLSDFLSKWVIQSSPFPAFSDSLRRDKMMQKLLTYKIEYDRLAEQELSSAGSSHTMIKCRQRNTSQYVVLVTHERMC